MCFFGGNFVFSPRRAGKRVPWHPLGGRGEGFRSGKRWMWMEIFVFLRYLLFPLETILSFFSSFPSARRGERISSSKLVKFNQIGLIFYRV